MLQYVTPFFWTCQAGEAGDEAACGAAPATALPARGAPGGRPLRPTRSQPAEPFLTKRVSPICSSQLLSWVDPLVGGP